MANFANVSILPALNLLFCFDAKIFRHFKPNRLLHWWFSVVRIVAFGYRFVFHALSEISTSTLYYNTHLKLSEVNLTVMAMLAILHISRL